MKILNLYAGLGGNRKNWKGCKVTAVEANKKINKMNSESNNLESESQPSASEGCMQRVVSQGDLIHFIH